MLKKSGLVQLYRGAEDFSSLGGLEALKTFARRALLQPSRGNHLQRARGLLLLSPPGREVAVREGLPELIPSYRFRRCTLTHAPLWMLVGIP